jgi:hypothetical protein
MVMSPAIIIPNLKLLVSASIDILVLIKLTAKKGANRKCEILLRCVHEFVASLDNNTEISITEKYPMVNHEKRFSFSILNGFLLSLIAINKPNTLSIANISIAKGFKANSTTGKAKTNQYIDLLSVIT